MKRWSKLAILTLPVLGLVLSLAACGASKIIDASKSSLYGSPSAKRYYLYNDSENDPPVRLGDPATPLNADEIYASLRYTPEMFYGDYMVTGKDINLTSSKATQGFIKKVGFEEHEIRAKGGYSDSVSEYSNLSVIPLELRAGPNSLRYSGFAACLPGNNWMLAKFLTNREYGYSAAYLVFRYELDGDVLRMQLLKDCVYDEEAKLVCDVEMSDLVLEYRFAFHGTGLTLSRNGVSYTLHAGYLWGNETAPRIICNHKLAPDSPRLDEITELFVYYNEQSKDHNLRVYYMEEGTENGTSQIANSGVISEDGLFTFTVPYDEGEKTYQFVYFYCYTDGMILTDGKEIYRFGTSQSDQILDVVDESVDLENITDSQVEQIQEAKQDVLDDLGKSFEEHEVAVDLNQETGRVTLDSSFLFGSDSAELSHEGKDYLDGFVQAYASVILSDTHAEDVAKILIEGHTDTDGSYDYNMALSERRAQAVADYCIGLEPGLEPYISVKGCSYDDPVYNADGSVNKDASRRVVFKFILNV